MTMTIAERLAASLVAEDATTAERHAGPCSICSRAILAGEKYAALVSSGKLAHLPCVARMALLRHGVPVIR